MYNKNFTQIYKTQHFKFFKLKHINKGSIFLNFLTNIKILFQKNVWIISNGVILFQKTTSVHTVISVKIAVKLVRNHKLILSATDSSNHEAMYVIINF